jgi:hydroxyacylglutathione hydrolase
MIVKQIWADNDARNFNYLIACGETGEALAIDPASYDKCLACALEHDWQITHVLNTHEHPDHIAGNARMIQATGAKLLAPEKAARLITGVDRGLAGGDVVTIGKSVELLVLDTPGHSPTHICLLSQTEAPALLSGDTLFNAGVGRCHHGDPEALFDTIAREIAPLADATLVYPGHDYFQNNLGFTLDLEPDNHRAASLQQELADSAHPHRPYVSTLGLERVINTFLRLSSPSMIDRLRASFPELPHEPSDKAVFLKLRELRDRW